MSAWSSEEIVVLCFLGAVASVYIWCARIIKHLGKRKPAIYELAILAAGALGICCFIYGAIEPYFLQTTFASFHSNKIKTHPVRIVHLTDLHCDGTLRTEAQLPDVVASLHPDLIVFTGDASNNQNGLKDFKECMNKLSKIAPVYGVYGNHDSRSGRGFDTLGESGVKKLDCSSDTITIKGNKIWLAGAAADGDGYAADTLASAPADAFSVYLYHYPSGINVAKASHIDIFCAGHTHGGQVRLPFYGALVTNSELGKQFEYGLYTVGDTHMNVSRGVGMIGLPVRFLAPPEVAVIDVKPGETSGDNKP